MVLVGVNEPKFSKIKHGPANLVVSGHVVVHHHQLHVLVDPRDVELEGFAPVRSLARFVLDLGLVLLAEVLDNDVGVHFGDQLGVPGQVGSCDLDRQGPVNRLG